MRIGNTFFIALAIGGLWGAIYIVVFSVLAMLISGETIVPDIGVALLSGVIGAGVYVLGRGRHRGWYWAMLSAAIALVAYVLLNALMSADGSASSVVFVAALVTFIVAAISWHLCLDGMGSESQKRYELEVILIRVLNCLLYTSPSPRDS